MPERIDEEGWGSQHGHVERYRWARKFIRPGDTVLDVACGIGYGAELLKEIDCSYIGVDKPAVPSQTFAREGVQWIAADLETWKPEFTWDVALCFETLEHLAAPERLVDILQSQTGRIVCVSVPVVETVGTNPWHLRDFTKESLRAMFDYWHVEEDWEQQSERSWVWAFKP